MKLLFTIFFFCLFFGPMALGENIPYFKDIKIGQLTAQDKYSACKKVKGVPEKNKCVVELLIGKSCGDQVVGVCYNNWRAAKLGGRGGTVSTDSAGCGKHEGGTRNVGVGAEDGDQAVGTLSGSR